MTKADGEYTGRGKTFFNFMGCFNSVQSGKGQEKDVSRVSSTYSVCSNTTSSVQNSSDKSPETYLNEKYFHTLFSSYPQIKFQQKLVKVNDDFQLLINSRNRWIRGLVIAVISEIMICCAVMILLKHQAPLAIMLPLSLIVVMVTAVFSIRQKNLCHQNIMVFKNTLLHELKEYKKSSSTEWPEAQKALQQYAQDNKTPLAQYFQQRDQMCCLVDEGVISTSVNHVQTSSGTSSDYLILSKIALNGLQVSSNNLQKFSEEQYSDNLTLNSEIPQPVNHAQTSSDIRSNHSASSNVDITITSHDPDQSSFPIAQHQLQNIKSFTQYPTDFQKVDSVNIHPQYLDLNNKCDTSQALKLNDSNPNIENINKLDESVDQSLVHQDVSRIFLINDEGRALCDACLLDELTTRDRQERLAFELVDLINNCLLASPMAIRSFLSFDCTPSLLKKTDLNYPGFEDDFQKAQAMFEYFQTKVRKDLDSSAKQKVLEPFADRISRLKTTCFHPFTPANGQQNTQEAYTLSSQQPGPSIENLDPVSATQTERRKDSGNPLNPLNQSIENDDDSNSVILSHQKEINKILSTLSLKPEELEMKAQFDALFSWIRKNIGDNDYEEHGARIGGDNHWILKIKEYLKQDPFLKTTFQPVIQTSVWKSLMSRNKKDPLEEGVKATLNGRMRRSIDWLTEYYHLQKPSQTPAEKALSVSVLEYVRDNLQPYVLETSSI